MKKKRIIAILLCLFLLITNVVPAAATELTDVTLEQQMEWLPDDFTYVEYEKLLYGCDYTRDFTVKGIAVGGFSELGEKKLEKNKDLVIPAQDDKGNTIIGVAENAFKNKGLTSVQFPTGMCVDYDDTVTNIITKRGNFVIAEGAFAGNELTSVTLPEGVVACLSYAFNNNKLERVKLPKTLWWIETMAFAQNRITRVEFPSSCDFQLEMHGLAFAKNFITSVRLPDFTSVVNKDVFSWNKGTEPLADNVKESYKIYEVDGVEYQSGVVAMYTDNPNLATMDRIHHTGKSTASQKSISQKLVVSDGTPETQKPDLPWTVDDFIIEGTVVKGLSASGIEKRATEKDLVIPARNKAGQHITEIAAASPGRSGLFASDTEKFDSVYLPSELKIVGDYAFQNSGLKEVVFPYALTKIGAVAFQMNNLTSVVLPDTVTSMGSGAFASNPLLERINLPKGLTKIPDSAFGCSDGKNYMTKLCSIQLREGTTDIGVRAFAGNNFANLVLPSTVKTIGAYAFSTKNYLTTPCTVTLNEGLESIGDNAFRNKVIDEITLPATVGALAKNTFRKEYSDSTEVVVTKVYVSQKSQYEDKENFPDSEYHELYLTDSSAWTEKDFTYGEQEFTLYPAGEYKETPNFKAWVVTGFSKTGLEKIEKNKVLIIPVADPQGKKVQGIANNAFENLGITSIILPENVKAEYDDTTWETTGKGVTERGDFFIGSSAFSGNALSTLELPEGVIYIGGNAFENNQITTVKIPETTMIIGNSALAQNNISAVEFPEETDFALQIDSMAFAINQIKSVQLPANMEKLDKYAFLQNTGMEPITEGTSSEKQGGLVYMYMNAEDAGPYMHYKSAGTSVVQELFLTAIPEELGAWGQADFTYGASGTEITGLTARGQAKIKENPVLVLPKTGPSGAAIAGLGDGTNLKGIFVYEEDGKCYTPASVLLPDTLKYIGNWAFALNAAAPYEAEMTSITLPEGLECIGQTAFQNGKLTSIVIPDTVTSMGAAAFTGCGNLTSVTLSKNLKEIPQSAFNAGSATEMALKEVIIPEGVTTVGRQAFAGTHVESVALPSTLTTIAQGAFENHQMTEIAFPANLKEIGKYAFKISQETLNKKLEKVVLNDGLVTIGQEAFAGNAITEMVLPESVMLSTENSGNDCIFGTKRVPASPIVELRTSSKEKSAEPGSEGSYNTSYANECSHVVVYDKLVGTGWDKEDFLYDEETGSLIGWSESGHEKRKTVKILILPDKTPEGKDIVRVSEAAFKIPDDEVIITKFGVDSPEGMKEVVLPEQLRVIEKEGFSQNAFTKVDFTGITSIGESALYGNDLVEVELPDTVTFLGSGAFSANDITKLRLSAGVTVIPQGAFSMNIRLDHVEIPDTVTEICATAFAGARLTTLTIPKSVKKIGTKAFHLHHLSELTIPGNVEEIGESAFEGTFKATTLHTLIIEDGVKSIGKYAFKEALLETVHFPDSIEYVGEKPFLNNKGKDGKQVVEVTTENPDHLSWGDDTYVIKYIGKPLPTLGDVTDDGIIDTSDAQAVFNHFMGINLLDEDALAWADINGDGMIDTTDAQAVFNMFMGI